MTVACVTEIKASSNKSFDAAIRDGLARAHRTLVKVKSAWVQNQELILNSRGEITEYRVLMKISATVQKRRWSRPKLRTSDLEGEIDGSASRREETQPDPALQVEESSCAATGF
ncbi:MAG: dodecin domain-containing protein [Candidatus Hydrogenedentes bacterium]|nr:dodecin domain-containing protein [Candidatus Hydrogenedentota bacterium]